MAKSIQYCKVKKKKKIYIYYTVDPWTKCVCSLIFDFFSINIFCYSTSSVVGWICRYGSMDTGMWILLTPCVLGGSTVHHSSESLPINHTVHLEIHSYMVGNIRTLAFDYQFCHSCHTCMAGIYRPQVWLPVLPQPSNNSEFVHDF